MKKLNQLSQRFIAALSSDKAWWLILGLFIVQALWMALSMVYPAVFDEAVHFETIRFYTQQWSPFFDAQPVTSDWLGQIVGQTSFLFYWLFSFVYRFLDLFNLTQPQMVLSLRMINIALFSGGLAIGRKLLREVNLSKAATNLVLFVFIMIPIAPQLAGQVNYDNPLFLLTNLALLMSIRFIKRLSLDQLEIQLLLTTVLVGVIASIIKVAFLPIFAAIIIVTSWQLHRYCSRGTVNWRVLVEQLRPTNSRQWALHLGLVVFGGLMLLRYGGNFIQYSQIEPSCDQVLSVERCRVFGPYGRDYELAQQRSSDFQPDLAEYTKEWYKGMHKRLLFTINGDTLVDRYQNFPPLPVVSAVSHGLVAATVMVLLVRVRQRLSNSTDILLLSVAGLYAATLFLRNYFTSYQETGLMVAINGRYLLMVLLPLMALSLKSTAELLREWTKTKSLLACLIIIGFIQGGGITGFIIRSHSSWWWPIPAIEQLNTTARSVIEPLIIGD